MDGDCGDIGGGHGGDCGHHDSGHHPGGDSPHYWDIESAGESSGASSGRSGIGAAKLKTKDAKNKEAVITFCIVAAVVVGAAILYRDWQQKHKEEAASNGVSR